MGAIQSSFESKFGSSHRKQPPDVFCKKGVLKDFTKFTGKHLFQSLKKRLWYSCFPVNFVKFLRTHFFIEHLWWLLLQVLKIFWKHSRQVSHFVKWHANEFTPNELNHQVTWIRDIDWYEIEIVLCVLCVIFLFFLLRLIE